MTVLIIVLVVIGVLVAKWLRAYASFRRLELAIPGPTSLPLVGNALSFLGANADNLFERVMQMWGDRMEMSRITVFGSMLISLSDPDDIAELMKRKDMLDKAEFIYQFVSEEAPNGLIQLNGAKWKEHRRGIVPAFHPEIVDSYAEVFAEEAEAFVGRIVPDREVDLYPGLFDMAAFNFLRTTMTSTVQGKDKAVMDKVLSLLRVFVISILERSFSPWLWPKLLYMLTPSARLVAAEKGEVYNYCDTILASRRKLASQGDTSEDRFFKKRKTLVEILLEGRNAGSSPFDDRDIKDEVLTFLMASVETTASVLALVLKMLSIRHDIQQRVHREVDEVLGGRRSVELDDIARLEYTEMVIKETMRLHAPIPFVGRRVKEQTDFCGKTLPAGTDLFINIYGVHRNPAHWPDPLRFDPDRFLPENSQGRHPYAYIPFSAGPRGCIGIRYSMIAMKTVIATVLRDYLVNPAEDGVTDHSELPYAFGLSLRIVGGAMVRFSPRSGVPA